ncbi:MAG: nuclear transport factor 2 family protein [Woeseiaceae bacterium]|nr:nuclear transport factor 2 family protein [Woeseiaceae bacterium]
MSSADPAGPDTTALFAAIDRKDTASFVDALTNDAVFRFGSAPEARGREAIAEAVGGFFETIAGLSHTVDKILWNGATQVCEGEVTYERHDGSAITLPFTDVFEYDGDLIAQYKIYMDIGPLYAT